jgi:polysaccharide export outer membrane protein
MIHRLLQRLSVVAVFCLLAIGSRAALAQRPLNPRPGDLIRLRVWREPDMSGDFTVDESGHVVLPRIGSLAVSQFSPDSLRAFIIAEYSPSLQNPSIEVTILRRIRVIGAVKNPGLYPVDQTLTVADVIALAGGVTTEGDQGKIRLSHTSGGQPTMVSMDSRIDALPLSSGDQIDVPQRSWLSRNAALAATVVSSIALIVITVAR